MDSPSSVYSQSTDGGSPRNTIESPLPRAVEHLPALTTRSAYREPLEQLQRLTARNLEEYARLRMQLDELNHRMDAMNSPEVYDYINSINERTSQSGAHVTTRNCGIDAALDTTTSSRRQSPTPPPLSIPTGVLYLPADGPPPPATGRVPRIARTQGLQLLRTSDCTSTSPSSYRLPRQRRQPMNQPSLANE